MKWKAALFALVLMLPLCISADTYVKTERHTDGYYRGGTNNPAVDEVRELWISPNRIAYIADGRKMLLDAEKKTFTYINLRSNIYAESALPLDLSKLFDEPSFEQMQMFQRSGEIKALEEKKKIGERECSGFELSDWFVYQGGKVNEREGAIWVTTDLPFDLAKFDALFDNLLKLNRFSDEYMKKYKKIKGFMIANKETTYAEGLAITTVGKVVEMTEKEPPADLYAIPEDCEKKEVLSQQDM